MADLVLDEQTLREGIVLLAALDRAGLTATIRQTSAAIDDQRDPTPAEYALALRRGSRSYGTLTGTAQQVAALLAELPPTPEARQ